MKSFRHVGHPLVELLCTIEAGRRLLCVIAILSILHLLFDFAKLLAHAGFRHLWRTGLLVNTSKRGCWEALLARKPLLFMNEGQISVWDSSRIPCSLGWTSLPRLRSGRLLPGSRHALRPSWIWIRSTWRPHH